MPTSLPDSGSRRLEYLLVSELESATRNVKQHANADIKRSIAKFGYVDPVVLDERTGRLVSGHGRVDSLRAAQADGDAAPEGIQVDKDGAWRVPVLRGWSSRSDDEAEAYLIAANRLTENGGWDDHGLAEVLADLADQQMLELTGYSAADLDDLIAGLQETGPLAASGGADDDEDDSLAGQTRQTRGLDDLKDDYEASNQRVLVLSYPGDVYVWMVNKLSHLMTELDVDTNSDAVLRLIEKATGETAPAADSPDTSG